MESTCTSLHLQLVSYLYQETTPLEDLQVVAAAQQNPATKQELTELASALHSLPKLALRPSNRALSNILEYSRQTALEKV